MAALDRAEQASADQQNHCRRDAEAARQATLQFGEEAVGVFLALRLEHIATRRDRGVTGRDNSLPGRGRTRLRLSHRSREASSTIHRTNSSNATPAYPASSGTRDVSVIPGRVFTSRQTSPPVPSMRSS